MHSFRLGNGGEGPPEMTQPKESPPDGGLVSEDLGGSSNNGNLPPLPPGFQCILCGSVFERRRLTDQFCPGCESWEGGTRGDY